MSEYQYYEFRAIDRPLSGGDRRALRAISSRAEITATSFVNHYEWGDFKGDPGELMERYFDLHLYLANWGARSLSLRFPRRLVDEALLPPIPEIEGESVLRAHGDNLIVHIARQELDLDDDTDGSEWLNKLAGLRADVLSGDLRLFYLPWLMALEEEGTIVDDETEPLPGIGPLTPALEAFGEFFGVDIDLFAAAAERKSQPAPREPSPDEIETAIRALPEDERISWLLRLHGGDPHLSGELRARIRNPVGTDARSGPFAARTAGELRARAEEIGHEREQRAKEKEAAERRKHLAPIEARGESAWRDVETEIEARQAKSYARAVELLIDLRDIAQQRGDVANFNTRLSDIGERHARKGQFLARLRAALAKSG